MARAGIHRIHVQQYRRARTSYPHSGQGARPRSDFMYSYPHRGQRIIKKPERAWRAAICLSSDSHLIRDVGGIGSSRSSDVCDRVVSCSSMDSYDVLAGFWSDTRTSRDSCSPRIHSSRRRNTSPRPRSASLHWLIPLMQGIDHMSQMIRN